MHDAVLTLSALLAGRGHSLWLVGAAARARVLSGSPPAHAELLTDASVEVAEQVRLTAQEVTGLTVRLASLGERDLGAWLRARGVTLDAVAVKADDGAVIDPFEGAADALKNTLRTIAPAADAFREDPLLLLRVPRLIAETGALAASELRRFATRDSGNILDTRARRAEWAAEFNALVLGKDVDRALQWLLETRVLAFLMPEVAAMVGFDKTCAVHHKDIWEHTRLVTAKAAPDLVVRWTALCHDIGKVWTRSVNRTGKVHFFRHEEHGAFLFEGIAHRIGLDPALAARVSYVIENHSRVNLYRDDWSDSAVRRMMRDTSGHLADLVAFSKADFTTKREAKIIELKRQVQDLEERLLRVAAEDARLPPLGKGIGEAIMARFGLPQSRAVGQLKAQLEAAIDAGLLPPRGDEAAYLDWLAENAIIPSSPKGAKGAESVTPAP